MTKQAESCKTRSRRARKAVRKPPETVRKRNHHGSLPLLPATRKAFSGSETAVPCSETAPSGGAFFAIFILQINGAVRGGTVRGQFCSFGHYPPSPRPTCLRNQKRMWNILNLSEILSPIEKIVVTLRRKRRQDDKQWGLTHKFHYPVLFRRAPFNIDIKTNT